MRTPLERAAPISAIGDRSPVSRSHPLLVAMALAAGIVALDALLPGLPGSSGGLVGRLTALLLGICPQRPSHSYFLGGIQPPLEARMLGMFGGLAAGVLVLATVGGAQAKRWPRRSVASALALGFGAMALDGSNALAFDLGLPHVYMPDLRLRLATGLLAGVAMAFALVPTLLQIESPGEIDHARSRSDPGPGWRDVGWTLLVGGMFALAVASGWGPFLYPVALVGAAGVVLALMLVNRVLLGVLVGDPLMAAIPDAASSAAAGDSRATPHAGRRQWWLGAVAAGAAVLQLLALAALRAAVLPH